ncbi:hypothetical protein D0Y65_001354, partial [Glycine soja]
MLFYFVIIYTRFSRHSSFQCRHFLCTYSFDFTTVSVEMMLNPARISFPYDLLPQQSILILRV